MTLHRHEHELSCRRCFAAHETGATSAAAGPVPFALAGAHPVYAPDRTCDVHHIKIEVTLDFATASVTGACTQTLVPITDGPTRVRLDAVEMTLAHVTLADGTAAPFEYDGRHLVVDLGERRAGEVVDLTVRYHATPRRGLYFLRPDARYPDRPTQAWTQGQDEDNRHWFPCFDHPHEKSTSEVIATVPERMIVVSNGKLLSARGKSGGAERQRTFHWRHELPHSSYLITLVAGEYVELKDSVDGVELSYLVPPARAEDAPRSFARTKEMLRLFGEKIGHRYPYERYAQVVVADFIFGGMENTTATTLTDATLHDERAHLDFSSEPLVAHELAHQWFGDLVTCRDWSHGWLNEGFATFFEIVWREHADGRDAADWDRLVDMDAYFEEDATRYRRPMVTNVFHEPIDLFDRHLYERGASVLHMLRRELGEARFWRAIQHYVAKHRLGSVESRDLARAIEEATGKNVDRFFDQWVFAAGHPVIETQYSWEESERAARLVVKQVQRARDKDKERAEKVTPFAFQVDVGFVCDGAPVTFTVRVDETHETFLFPLPAKPTQAIFDLGKHVLARVREKKGHALWAAQLAEAAHAVDRIRAARSMGHLGDTLSVAPLARSLVEDPFWAVRGEAADALGKYRTDEARDALVTALAAEPHPKARRRVARALGQWRGDPSVAAALGRALAGDASYFVEAEAALALGKTRAEAAFDTLVQAMTRPSHQEVVRAHCLQGLGELRDERAFDVALAEAQPGKHPASRRAAIVLVGRLGDEHPGRRRQALEALTDLLDDADFRARIAAVDALRVLGDPRALGALERATAGDLDGRVCRRAREVTRMLHEGLRSKQELTTLRDEIEKLRESGDKLRERVLKLEAKPS